MPNTLGNSVVHNCGHITVASTVIPVEPPHAIEIRDEQGDMLLIIGYQGEVRFGKNPNEAARRLVSLCQAHIDTDAAGVRAMQRSYRRGLEKCLRLAGNVEKDQLIDLLDQEIKVRLESEMMQLLRETGEE